MADYRSQFRELLESTYISSLESEESIVRKMTAFFNAVIPFIPERLYRFRKMDEKGYSVDAFRNGTITLCKASLFPDKYDSQVFIDNHKIKNELVKYLREAMSFVLKDINQKNPAIKTEKASKIYYYKECGLSDKQIIEKIVEEEYADIISTIEIEMKGREPRFRIAERTARVACFTESVQSKFMWDVYAGGYTGFALEYNLRKYFTKSLEHLQQVYVFPVIYSDTKPDLTDVEFNNYVMEQCAVREEMKGLMPIIQKMSFNLISPFKPFLYKDKQAYEHEWEWRMLYYELGLVEDVVLKSDNDCLTGIFYGPDIREADRALLHTIAMEKGIKESIVSLDKESRRFDLMVLDY